MVSGDASAGENGLDVEPGVVIDEWLVRTIVDDPAVHKPADVVRVRQHPVHLGIG